MAFLLLITGLVLLVVGGDWLVKGAVSLALKFKVDTLLIGTTVVAFGTSMPELMVSVNAALNGNPDIAAGNVIGSNIANIGLILGITALIFPLAIKRTMMRMEFTAMMVATIILLFFIQNHVLERWEGIFLFVSLIVFVIYSIRVSKKNYVAPVVIEEGDPSLPQWKIIGFIIFGIAGLMAGAHLLITGAISIATALGVSERIIGVTLVAFGTSVPELFTSVMAAVRKETEISIGNLIGSNIFNILCILGITSIIAPINIDPLMVNVDGWWMVGISFLILPFYLINKSVNRIEGGILTLTYLIFIYSVLV